MRTVVRHVSLVLVVLFVGVGILFAGGEKEQAGPQQEGPTCRDAWEADASPDEMARACAIAEPGEEFMVGHITFHLGQQYAVMTYQSIQQAAEQMGLTFQGQVAETQSDWIEITESMIASGAKIIIYNVPPVSIMPELAQIAEENDVYLGTYFGYNGEIMPGDAGPRWVVDNTPLSAIQTYMPITLLFEKMTQDNRNRVLIHQASNSAATVSQVFIGLGIFQALQNYPNLNLTGFQYGEWGFEGGRAAAEASLAERQDYQGFWGANDSQTLGALRALQDRGLNIGPYTASRDGELSVAQEIVNGNFLATSTFDIPYYAGRLVPMLYDMAVGAWYPQEDEYLQAGSLNVYGQEEEIRPLAESAGIADHPNFNVSPVQPNIDRILTEMEADNPEYPYDFRLLSRSKVEEEGLEYDRHAGAGTELGANDYYYPAKMDKFGTIDAFRQHVQALHEHFLDYSWMTDLETANQYAEENFSDAIKLEPMWE